MLVQLFGAAALRLPALPVAAGYVFSRSSRNRRSSALLSGVS